MPPKEPVLTQNFAQTIKRHRESQGLSRMALSERAGVHQTYIGLLERAARSPSLETAKSIADALNVPLAKLIEESEG